MFDGNRTSVPLFINSKKYSTQPDYYFRRHTTNVAVADAKYKLKIATEDRYALIAFCEALNVTKAAFVCPHYGTDPLVAHQGTTRSGIEIHVIRIDLNAMDLKAEENRFQTEIAASLGL